LMTSLFSDKFSRPLFFIILFYIVWIGTSHLLYGIAAFFPPVTLFSEGLVALSIFLHIFFFALVTAGFLTRVQPMIEFHHRYRGVLISISAALTVSLYVYTRFFNPGISVFLFMLNTANLIVFANLVGSWMAFPLKRATELVPVCLVMVLADLFSVMGGPTQKIIERLQEYYAGGMAGPVPAAEFILVKIAVPGADRLVSIFGLADWIMVVFLAAAAAKFNMNDNLAGPGAAGKGSWRPIVYMPVSGMGLLTAVLLAHQLGLFLPALPFIVLFFMSYILVRYPEARRLSRSDWLTTGGAAAVMCAIMAILQFR